MRKAFAKRFEGMIRPGGDERSALIVLVRDGSVHRLARPNSMPPDGRGNRRRLSRCPCSAQPLAAVRIRKSMMQEIYDAVGPRVVSGYHDHQDPKPRVDRRDGHQLL